MGNRKSKPELLTASRALRVLQVADLQVDPSYQRGLGAKHLKIAENFNKDALGTPNVGEREDGSLWVVDGQQRIAALKKMDVKEVRCNVFASKGPEHEAQIFRIINMDRTRLNQRELYFALLTAGDETAWTVKELIAKHDFLVNKYGNETKDLEKAARAIGCVGTLCSLCRDPKNVKKGSHTFQVGTPIGPAGVDWILGTLAQVWQMDPLRTKSEIICGMAVFWKTHEGVVDMDRFIPRLRTVTPAKLMYAASMGVGGRSTNIAEALEKVYRKRAVGRPRAN